MPEGAARGSSLGFRGSRGSRGSKGARRCAECFRINKDLIVDNTEWKIAATPLSY